MRCFSDHGMILGLFPSVIERLADLRNNRARLYSETVLMAAWVGPRWRGGEGWELARYNAETDASNAAEKCS